MMMSIHLDGSLFCEQGTLVVDVIDQRFKTIVSLGDPSAREGIRATDICLRDFCHLFVLTLKNFELSKSVNIIGLITYPCFKILLVDVIDDLRSAQKSVHIEMTNIVIRPMNVESIFILLIFRILKNQFQYNFSRVH